jgi:hypothetical protein
MAAIENEKAKLTWKNIDNVVRKAVLKEGCNRTRILYSGIHPQEVDSLVVYRIVELLRGYYFLEETVFNVKVKSVSSSLTSLSKQNFHKIIKPEEKMHDMEFNPNAQIIAGVSYTRRLQTGTRTFHNSIITDYRSNRGWLSGICDYYLNFRIRNYLNKKI